MVKNVMNGNSIKVTAPLDFISECTQNNVHMEMKYFESQPYFSRKTLEIILGSNKP